MASEWVLLTCGADGVAVWDVGGGAGLLQTDARLEPPETVHRLVAERRRHPICRRCWCCCRCRCCRVLDGAWCSTSSPTLDRYYIPRISLFNLLHACSHDLNWTGRTLEHRVNGRIGNMYAANHNRALTALVSLQSINTKFSLHAANIPLRIVKIIIIIIVSIISGNVAWMKDRLNRTN